MAYLVFEFDREAGVPAVITEGGDSGLDEKYASGRPLGAEEAPIELKLVTDSPRETYPDILN